MTMLISKKLWTDTWRYQIQYNSSQFVRAEKEIG